MQYKNIVLSRRSAREANLHLLKASGDILAGTISLQNHIHLKKYYLAYMFDCPINCQKGKIYATTKT